MDWRMEGDALKLMISKGWKEVAHSKGLVDKFIAILEGEAAKGGEKEQGRLRINQRKECNAVKGGDDFLRAERECSFKGSVPQDVDSSSRREYG